ncbi:MAG: hypothetical protein ACRCX2_10575 [Paraclostridium sp.]
MNNSTLINETKSTLTTLEILEQINFFRKAEGIQSPMLHKNLLAIVRSEFEEEINELKIQPVNYEDKKGESRAMFELTLNQAKQILMKESKYVRKAMITYIDELEAKLRNPVANYTRKELFLLAVEYEEKIESLQLENKELERTKSWINDKKVATSVGRLGGLTKSLNTTKAKVVELESKLTKYEYPMHEVVLNNQQWFSYNAALEVRNNKIVRSKRKIAYDYNFQMNNLIIALANFKKPESGVIKYKLSGSVRKSFDWDAPLKICQDKLAEALCLDDDSRLVFDGWCDDVVRCDDWSEERIVIRLEVR